MRSSVLFLLGLGLSVAADASAQCPNDDSLGNSSFSTPEILPPGASLYLDLVIPASPANQTPLFDWFEFELAPGATAEFTIDRPTAGTAMYAQIYTAASSFLSGTPFATGQFTTSFTNPDTVVNSYRLIVSSGFASNVPTPCSHYHLTASVDPCASDDVIEDFDVCDASFPLPPSRSVQFDQLAVRATDEDWFDIAVQPGETFTADIAFTHANGDVDMTLVDATGGGCGPTLLTSASTSDMESVTYTNNGTNPVELHVGVYLFSGTCNAYSMDWSVTSASDDVFEDNDEICSPAFGLSDGVYSDLFVNDTDSDFYHETLPDNTRIVFAMDFDHSDGDLDMRLWDVTAGCTTPTLISSSDSTSDYEEVIVSNTGTTPMEVVCEVLYYPSDGGSNTYTLTAARGFATRIGETVCDAVPNSINDRGLMFASGSAVAADNNITLFCQALPPNQFGFYTTSRDFGFVANPGGSTGNLCIAGGPIGRLVGPGQILNTGSAGAAVLPIDLTQLPLAGSTFAAAAGEIWFFQFWHRDQIGGTQTSNFSRALRIRFE